MTGGNSAAGQAMALLALLIFEGVCMPFFVGKQPACRQLFNAHHAAAPHVLHHAEVCESSQ